MNDAITLQPTVCVDFDATILPWGPLMAPRPPFEGVREALVSLREAGYRIVILTSRLSQEWIDTTNPVYFDGFEPTIENQRAYVASVLNQYGIPFDLITAEKVPARVYFDDKAVGVTATYPLDVAVSDFLQGRVP